MGIKKKLDMATVERILSASVPGLGFTSASNEETANFEASEILSFLTSEIIASLKSSLSSPSNLHGIIGDHLLDLGLCKDDLECQLLCEDIHEGLLSPEQFSWKEAADKDYEDLEPGQCEMCERVPMPLTFHHLIPRKVHKKIGKRMGLSKEELNVGALLCRQCHNAVHGCIDHETLALEYNTVEKLLMHEKLKRWAAYASKQKVGGIKGRNSRR